ncbi:hypothetical protein CQK57_03445 [Salmonella enterica]|uniref:hypothetical protein n=1 Tax=Salmonella enterica TaxID=28901 RepID=UPI0009B181E7|nr:hypothetical protein [Salmonella enterica]EBG8067310.1 hypothetical protein [Salmonella enterica subsp. enterica serovar Elisabethville]EBW3367820.1 hypothetical protein [Salmonella enterica subsp. enterica serovar Wangata]ECG2650948.1 hypothetical protein [Salmonella enterica subsp. enterica serovar Chailey]EEA5912659.1 hypothetical protein [Salmonella enterica subsp. enterica serovar Tafo]EED8015725.1 hypothetical protein [Salmonella enterica subsp. enterica]MJU51644.1 hypothetical prote
MNKSTLFTNAWTIARNAANQFGGSVKSYFAESLKLAYTQMSAPKELTAASCLRLGGKLWEKNGMSRVYFNSDVVSEVIEFDYSTYKTGNISSASLGDSHLSNCRASSIRSMLSTTKFWFDAADGKIHARGFNSRDLSMSDVCKLIKSAALAA